MRRRLALLGLAGTLLVGCGVSSHSAARQPSSRLLGELRYAAEQEVLVCSAGRVVTLNAHSLRRECVKRTPAEMWAEIQKLLDRCHGESELFVGRHFVSCVRN
jgi:hypothetical protein